MVVEVKEPESLDGDLSHVTGPCTFFKVCDRITIAGNPGARDLKRPSLKDWLSTIT